MDHKELVIIVLALAALLGSFSRQSSVAQSPPADRARAPDFSLPQLNGKTLRLHDYRGKVILLDFWATWCDSCRDEIPRFESLQSKYGKQGLQIIGVAMDDSTDPVKDFDRRFKMNYPVVLGNAKTGELYGGVLGLPVAFLIDRDGRIYAKQVGATDIAVFEREIMRLVSK